MNRRTSPGMLLWLGVTVVTCLGAGFMGGMALRRLEQPDRAESETLASYVGRLEAHLDLSEPQSGAIRDVLDRLSGEIDETLAEKREEVRAFCTRLRSRAHEEIRAQLDDKQRRMFDGE